MTKFNITAFTDCRVESTTEIRKILHILVGIDYPFLILIKYTGWLYFKLATLMCRDTELAIAVRTQDVKLRYLRLCDDGVSTESVNLFNNQKAYWLIVIHLEMLLD